MGDVVLGGQSIAAHAGALDAVELIDVGAVLVRDEDAEAVVGEADALRIEAGVAGISGVLIGVVVVGAASEEVLGDVIGRGCSGAYAEASARAVSERGGAGEQGGFFERRGDGEGQGGAGGAGEEVHLDGVEAFDVAGGLVDCGVIGDGVGTTVGEGEEAVGGHIGDA